MMVMVPFQYEKMVVHKKVSVKNELTVPFIKLIVDTTKLLMSFSS